jgi:hypothetical protein
VRQQQPSSTEPEDEWCLPLIGLIDGTGGSARTLDQIGRTYILDNPGWVTITTGPSSLLAVSPAC